MSEASEGHSKVSEYSSKQSDTAVCSLCKSVVVVKGRYISNLPTHLRIHHPLKHTEIRTALKQAKCGCSEKLIKRSKLLCNMC